jgi:hypothetical protein
MEQEQYHFAWRTLTGEKNYFKKKRMEKEPNLRHCCTWYYCADKNMENEMVLVYAVEKNKELKNTSLKHEDRFLQKITASGKSCSGKVTKFAKIAVPGSYNQDGTIKQ